MKRAARLAELEAKPSLKPSERWEMQRLRRRLPENEALKIRYQTDPEYRWRKMRQSAVRYYRQTHMEAAE